MVTEAFIADLNRGFHKIIRKFSLQTPVNHPKKFHEIPLNIRPSFKLLRKMSIYELKIHHRHHFVPKHFHENRIKYKKINWITLHKVI